MKFIKQLLCSCWRATPVKQTIAENNKYHSRSWVPRTPAWRTAVASLDQESLLPLAGKLQRKVLRGSKSFPVGTTNWKPSLCSIMEDKIVLPAVVIGAESRKKPTVPGRRSISIADIRLDGHNFGDLRRSSPFSTVQAFSPASSFLF